MLLKYRPYWGDLTSQERWAIWKALRRAKGLPHHTMRSPNGIALFDKLHADGVYQSETVAALWNDDVWRPLIAKTMGIKL